DPLTEFLTERVAAAYAALVASFTDPAVLELIPGPLGTEPLDVALHRAVRDALGATPFVPAPDGARLRPRDTVLVEGLTAAARSDPLTEFLTERVAAAYAALVASFTDPAVLELIPGPLGTEPLDVALHRAVRDALGATPFVPAPDGARLRPRDTVLVEGLTAAA